MSGCPSDLKTTIFFFETYKAMHLHFTSSYDFFKYNGKLKHRITTQEQADEFYRSKNYPFSRKLSRKRNNKLEMVEFLLANLSNNPNMWLEELVDDRAEETFNKWKKTQDSLTYTFTKDVNFILSHNKHFNSYFVVSNGYPEIVEYVMNQDISFETAIIMNEILKFMPQIVAKFKKDIILGSINERMSKYAPFVMSYHNLEGEGLKKFKDILKRKVTDNLNTLPF